MTHVEWCGSQEQLLSYLPADLLADSVTESGLALLGTTYLQAGWLGDPSGETSWADSVANSTNGVIATGIIGTMDLLASFEETEATIKRHLAASSRFRGIRDMELARPRKGAELLTDSRVLK